ncbi:hypothetical protein [Flexivirga meconopsidis]|uniref:hypothetical protein n=1 Tax=Flexivirga meconopsidis TaxID=2977121 RepID=UPI002240990E|nr:hypothetical protein [Flexivirga meconopsidis]
MPDPQQPEHQPPYGAGYPASALPPEPLTGTPAAQPPLQQARWSGKKTAVVAALAIGLASGSAITASAAVPAGSTQQGPTGRMGQNPPPAP